MNHETTRNKTGNSPALLRVNSCVFVVSLSCFCINRIKIDLVTGAAQSFETEGAGMLEYFHEQ